MEVEALDKETHCPKCDQVVFQHRYIFKNQAVVIAVDIVYGITQKGKYISKDKKFNALIKNVEI